MSDQPSADAAKKRYLWFPSMLLLACLSSPSLADAQRTISPPRVLLDSTQLEELRERIKGEQRARVRWTRGHAEVVYPSLTAAGFVYSVSGNPSSVDTLSLPSIRTIEIRQGQAPLFAVGAGLGFGVLGFAYKLITTTRIQVDGQSLYLACPREPGGFGFDLSDLIPCPLHFDIGAARARIEIGRALRTGIISAALGGVVGAILGQKVFKRWNVVYTVRP